MNYLQAEKRYPIPACYGLRRIFQRHFVRPYSTEMQYFIGHYPRSSSFWAILRPVGVEANPLSAVSFNAAGI